VESKVRLLDGDLGQIEAQLLDQGVTLGSAIHQKDVYFKEQGFRDKVHGAGSYLVRVRYAAHGTTLNMKRLTETDGVWEEIETPVENGEIVEQILLTIGVEHAVTVDKKRRMAKLDDLEIIIDEVADLGTFLELAIEGGGSVTEARARINIFLGKLGISSDRVELRGYPSIILEDQGVRFSSK